MIRGTTQQFRFKLPYNIDQIESVKITFWQNDNNGPSADRPLPIIKTLQHCDSSNNELYITLNQEETLRFSDDKKAFAQIRIRTLQGFVAASKLKEIIVYPLHDDNTLGDVTTLPLPDDDNVTILDGGSIVQDGGDG